MLDGSPLHGLQETIPRNPSRLISFMGKLELDHAVSRRLPSQHSSLVTPLISTMAHRWSWPCCSQQIPAGNSPHRYTTKGFSNITSVLLRLCFFSTLKLNCSSRCSQKSWSKLKCNNIWGKVWHCFERYYSFVQTNKETKKNLNKVHSPLAGFLPIWQRVTIVPKIKMKKVIV